MNLHDLIRKLADLTRDRVHLHFNPNDGGIWSVHVPLGNIMTCVPETVTHDPFQSLYVAINRWLNRSNEKPFTY